LLTDEEAEQLKLDERVFDVEIPPEHRTDLVKLQRQVQRGDFTKTTSDSGAYNNWAMIRCNFDFNVYGAGTTTTSSYEYCLTGDGVDVVIQDSGLEVGHPEFQDEFGVSRVQQINWYTESGISGTQSVNHYRDYNGHGTHVASSVAGKYFGWAKKARVYSQKLNGLEGSGDSGTGISETDAFDAIKLWHRNKPINPKTGKKRPTIVNMSWGYGQTFSSVTSVNYRGTTYSDASTTGNATYREQTYGIVNNTYLGSFIINLRVSSVDVDVEEMADEGILVCIAAGNRGTKIDVVGGTDYNNYILSGGSNLYYHRGSSPWSSKAIVVGNIDSTTYNSFTDQKATSSETGPGVDIYAPGTDIMGACSTTNEFTDQAYSYNSSYRQMNISGTSMASPQVAGVAALLYEINPGASVSDIKNSLLLNSNGDLYATLNNNDWSSRRSLLGGTTRVLFNKFGKSQTSKIAGDLTFKGGINIKMV
jgi:subtilisin family serine protease